MKTVVVVDDNKMFLETLKDFIECDYYNCVAFSNPEDALRYVMENEVYAVVSDFEMPQMSGLELAKKIIEAISETKIIIMSGYDTNYLRKCVLGVGIDEKKIQLLCKSDILNLFDLLDS